MSSRSAQGLDVLKRLAKDKRCMLSFRGIGGIGLHGQLGGLVMRCGMQTKQRARHTSFEGCVVTALSVMVFHNPSTLIWTTAL